MTDNEIERLAAEFIAEDWEPDRYYRDMNIIAFATKLLEHAYAEGRKDEREAGEMSLRDRFAAQSMFGLLAQPNFHPIHNASYCYEVADAMLEARKS